MNVWMFRANFRPPVRVSRHLRRDHFDAETNESVLYYTVVLELLVQIHGDILSELMKSSILVSIGLVSLINHLY